MKRMFGLWSVPLLAGLQIAGLSIFSTTPVIADTYVSGIIDTNSVWTPAGNPYIVTGDVTVDTDITLTILPGTIVKFTYLSDDQFGGADASRCELIVNGKLLAEGTPADSIIFTSTAATPAKKDWYWIKFNDSADDNSKISYSRIEWARDAIYIYLAQPTIAHSTIQHNNQWGIHVQGDYLSITLEYNAFLDNDYGIYTNYSEYSTITVANNAFSDNNVGIGSYECRYSVITMDSNNISNNNSMGVSFSGSSYNNPVGSAIITNNEISNNQSIGVYVFGRFLSDSLRMTGNEIYGNGGDGINLHCRQGVAVIQENDIYDNGSLPSYYYIRNKSPMSVDARYNWWGADVTHEMDSLGYPADISVIWDIEDEASLGRVNYDNWKLGPPSGPITTNASVSPDSVEAGAQIVLTATVSDTATGNSNIGEAEWFRDYIGSSGTGNPLEALDGAFDEPVEDIIDSISTSGWSIGMHSLYIHGKDTNNYWGPYDTTFVWIIPGADTVAPGAPINLTANGSNPSPWTNDPEFVINWTNPPDPSGISEYYYKLGLAPSSDFDTSGTFHYPPDTITATQENGQLLYVWLVDSSGNVDYNNYASVNLRYDATPSAPFSLISPLDSAYVDTTRPTFTWQSSSDAMSGVMFYESWIDAIIRDSIADTSWTANYDLTEGSHAWYVVAYDSAGNYRISNETWTVIIDTTTPAPDIEVSATSHDFGNVALGDSSDWTFKIYNTGNNTLTVDSCQLTVDSDFSVVSPSFPQSVLSSDTVDVTLRFKPTVIGLVKDTLNIYSNDPDEGIVNIELTGNGIDTTAPASPESLVANGSNPSPWTNDSMFVINWTNPEPGITMALYKFDTPPDSNYDTTGTLSPFPPCSVFCTNEGITPLHLWLVDSAGNVDCNNYSSVDLRYVVDTIPPAHSVASSPDTSCKLFFPVNWTIGSDEGSGLSGKYIVKVTESPADSWNIWLDSEEATSANYTGEQGHWYYFEAGAIDNAGNIELFTELPECSTYIDTLVPDTAAPSPPQGVWAIGGDKEITILWSANTEQDLAGYNVYRSDSTGGPYARINPYTITGTWYKDADLPEDTTFYYVATAIDISGNESKYSAETSASTSNLPPLPVSEFTGMPIADAKIELSWIISPSYDVYKYNIYWDAGSGNIDYGVIHAEVMHPETTWTSNPLTPGETYKFGIRAEDGMYEEKNTGVVVSVTALESTAGLVKAQIITPYAGKRIWGRRVTVHSKIVYGAKEEVECVFFQYKPTLVGEWTDIQSANPNHPNPDSVHPYFVHWDVTGIDMGYYDIRSVATDTGGNPDANPSYITIAIDSIFPDEIEDADSSKISEHWKKEKVYHNSGNYLICGTGDENTVNRVMIPANAVYNDTRIVYYIRDAGQYDVSPYKPANEFRELILENGQEILSQGKEQELEIPYLDEDNNGIVDGTDIAEDSLWLAYYNEATESWDALEFTIDTLNHKVIGWSRSTGLFAILGSTVGIEEPDNRLQITDYRLFQNFPNPFTQKTEIRFQISDFRYQNPDIRHLTSDISLKIYDLSGRLVKSFSLIPNPQSLTTVVEWDGRNDQGKKLASGIYFIRFEAGDFRDTKKLAILR